MSTTFEDAANYDAEPVRERSGRRWWWPRRSAAPRAFVMPGYTAPNIWRNNRKKLIALFALVSFIYGLTFGLFTTFALMQLAVPLIIIAGIIIWLLPDTKNPPTTALDRLLIAFIIGLLCWPNYLAIALPGMPWVTVVRLIAAPLALVMLTCLSVSSGFRKQMYEIISAMPIIWKALLAFMTLGLLSIGLSSEIGNSINKFSVAMLYWVLIFFASCYTFAKRGRANLFVYVLWASVIFVALVAIDEARNNKVFWADHIPSFLKVDETITGKMVAGGIRKATGLYRAKAVHTTALGLAEFLALSAPFLIHIVIEWRKPVLRVAAAVSIPVLFYAITLTDSRLGMVGFLVGMLLYILLWSLEFWWRNKSNPFGPALILAYPAVFTAFMAATFYVRRLEVMVWGSGATAASNLSREMQWARGIPKILANPFGYGIGQSGTELGFRNQAGVASIDSYYLSILLEYGVLGFIIYYGMFIYAAVQGGKVSLDARTQETRLLRPLAISIVAFCVIKGVFSQEANHPLLFAMLGMIVALTYRVRKEQAEAAKTEILAPLRGENALPKMARLNGGSRRTG